MPWKLWQPGDPVTINRIIWDGIETEYIQDVLERDWFGPGYYAGQLEQSLCDFVGVKYAQLTNSGSSALLLGTQALQKMGLWKKGDLILHPACTFPTSCNPIIQSGMNPCFVDVEEGTYNLDMEPTRDAIKRNSALRGAIVPHLLGNSSKMDELLDALGNRPLIEDCCDTLGSKYDGKMCGTFGKLAAFSFYGSHHITTAGVGGALLTDDEEIYNLVKSMTFWGREQFKTDDPYLAFTKRYSYETIGYDMQISEMQAAFGLAQFQRLDSLNILRDKQFDLMDEFMEQWSHWLVLPESHPLAAPSWFGYPILVSEDAPFNREDFARHLLAAKIEIRPLFCGNLIRHEAYRTVPYVVSGNIVQANRNMERSMFLPAWGGMADEVTAYLFEIIESFMRQYE